MPIPSEHLERLERPVNLLVTASRRYPELFYVRDGETFEVRLQRT